MRPTPSISLAAAPSSDVSRVAVELAVNQFASDIEELTTGTIVLVADSIGGALSAGILAHRGNRVSTWSTSGWRQRSAPPNRPFVCRWPVSSGPSIDEPSLSAYS